MSGDLEKAWKVVEESGLPFSTFKERVQMRLLDGVEHATIWPDDVRQAMIKKYDHDLRKIERAFGVQWTPRKGGDEGEGTHLLIGDQEEALERLGAEGWRLEQHYGYPYEHDDEVLVQERAERSLHDAEERGLAQDQQQTKDVTVAGTGV